MSKRFQILLKKQISTIRKKTDDEVNDDGAVGVGVVCVACV